MDPRKSAGDPGGLSAGSRGSHAWRPPSQALRGATSRTRRLVKALLTALGLTAVAVAIVALLFFSGSPEGPSLRFATRFVNSYGNYPPNAGAFADEEAFASLFAVSTSPQRPVSRDLIVDQTLTDKLARLPQLDSADPIRRDKSDRSRPNVIVFWSGHAECNPDSGNGIELIAVRNGQTDEKSIPLSSLLRLVRDEDAKEVLLFLDVGRLEPEWSLGILSRDAVAIIPREIDHALKSKPGGPRLRVLCSVSPGETSWVLPEEGRLDARGQSVFGHFLAEALRGDCDGFVGKPDQKVDANELITYVRQKVLDWSKKNRGVEQNVLVIPTDNGIEHDRVALFRLREPSKTIVPDPNTVKSDGQTVAADKKEELSAATGPVSSSQDTNKPKSEADAVSSSKTSKEDPARRLDTLWTTFARLYENDAVLALAPYRLRALHANLIRAEELIDAGLVKNEQFSKRMEIAEELVGQSQESVGSGVKRALPSSDAVDSLVDPSVGAEKQKQFREYFKALSEDSGAPPSQAAAKPQPSAAGEGAKAAAPAKAPPALRLNFDDPNEGGRFVFWLFDSSSGLDLKRLRAFSRNLRTSEPTLPSAWLFFCDACQVANPTDATERATLQQALALRFDVAQLLSLLNETPDLFDVVKGPIADAFDAVRAARTWLGHGDGLGSTSSFSAQREDLERSAEGLRKTARQLAVYRRAVSLRNRLFAELPDCARWIARRAENPRVGQPLSTRVLESFQLWAKSAARGQWTGGPFPLAQDENSALLYALMSDAVSLDAILNKTRPAPADGVARSEWLDEEALKQFDRAKLEQLKARIRTSFSGTDVMRLDQRGGLADFNEWHSLRLAMPLPWMASQRSTWRKLLLSPPKSSEVEPSRSSGEGVWQAYWCLQTLYLSGAQPEELKASCDQFQQLVAALLAQKQELAHREKDKPDASAANSVEKVVRLRSELGRALKARWIALFDHAVNPGTDARQNERAIRTVDGLLVLSKEARAATTPDTTILAARRTRDLEELTRAQSALGESMTTAERPALHLGLDPPNLVFDPSKRSAKLLVSVVGDRAGRGPLKLILGRDPNRMRAVGDHGEELPAEFSIGQEPVPITLTLAGRGRDSGTVTLNLVESIASLSDATKQRHFLQHDVQVPYRTAADYSGWRIEFATAENLRAHQVPGFANAARSENPRRRVEIVSLPAAGTFGLSPRLVRPEGDRTGAELVELDCYALGADGNPGAKIFEKAKVSIASNVGAANIVVAPPAAEPKKEAAVAPKDLIDLTHGLLFYLRPSTPPAPTAESTTASVSGSKVVHELEIQFRRWSRSNYIVTPRVDANLLQDPINPRIEISLEPSGQPAELASGEQSLLEDFAVELNVLDEFPITGGSTTKVELKRGEGTRKVSVPFDRTRLDPNRVYRLSLDVGPWTHAYRFECRGVGGGVEVKDVSAASSVRIVSPLNRSVFVPKDKQLDPNGGVVDPNIAPTALAIDVPDLDEAVNASPLTLERQILTIIDDGKRLALAEPDRIDTKVLGSWRKGISLARPSSEKWEFTTRLNDYATELKYGGFDGRYVMKIALRDQQKRDELVAQESVTFSVDSKAPRVKVTGLRAKYESTETPRFRVEAADDESGIASIVGALVARGKAVPPEIGDPDVVFRHKETIQADGFPRTSQSLTFEVSREKWPQGDFDLYVLAKDAVGHESARDPVHILLLPKPAPANPPQMSGPTPPAAPPKPGTLVVSFGRFGKCKLKLSDASIPEKERDTLDDSVSFDRVPAGDYKLTWQGFGGRNGSLDVKIKPEETTAVTVSPP